MAGTMTPANFVESVDWRNLFEYVSMGKFHIPKRTCITERLDKYGDVVKDLV